MVKWNDLADKLAGEVWNGLPGAVPKAPEMKCKADCQPASPCSACMWNQQVNAFLQDLHPIPVSLPLWQPTSSSRHSTLPASLTLASASSVPLSSSSLKPRKEQRKEKSKKDMKKDTSSDDEWEYHGMKKQRNHSFPSPPSLPASSLDTRAPSSEPTPKEYQCPLCPFTCTAYIGLFGHQKIHKNAAPSVPVSD